MLRVLAVWQLVQACAGSAVRLSSTSCLSSPSQSDELLDISDFFAQLDTRWDPPTASDDAGKSSLLRVVGFGKTSSQQSGYSNVTNFLATLITDTSILSFVPYQNQSSLCSAITSPAGTQGCPFGPGDIAIGQTIPLDHSYPFTTLNARFTILDTSTPPKQLACYDIHTTTYLPNHFLYTLVLWLPAGALIAYALLQVASRMFAAVTTTQADLEAAIAASLTAKISPITRWNRVSLALVQWASGRDVVRSKSLVRHVTPTVTEVLSWIQFFTMLSLCSVKWPDFVYPIFAKTAWSLGVFDLPWIKHPSDFRDASSSDDNLLPASYATQIVDPTSPIYLDPSLSDNLLNLHNTTDGLPSLALAAHKEPSNLFASCASILLLLIGGIMVSGFIGFIISWLIERTNNRRHSAMNLTPHSAIFPHKSAEFSLNKSADFSMKEEVISPVMDDADSGPGEGSRAESNLLSQKGGMTKPKVTFWKGTSGSVISAGQKNSMAAYWLAFLHGNIIRLIIAFHLPLTIFSVYQLSHNDSTALTALAALTFSTFCVVIPMATLYRIWKHRTVDLLENRVHLLRYGSLYNVYAADSLNYCVLRILVTLFEGIVVGAGQKSGAVQVIMLLVIEIADAVFTSFWLPWHEGASMAPLAFVTSVLRIISMVLMLTLTSLIGLSITAINWIAYVILLLQGIILLFIFLLLACKIIELAVRLVAHVPFEYGRSSRSGGLVGAIRKLDRNSNNSIHNRKRKRREKALAAAKAITEGKNTAGYVGQSPITSANVSNDGHADNYGGPRRASRYSVGTSVFFDESHSPSGYFSRVPARITPSEEDDGNIMSAWNSQYMNRSPTHTSPSSPQMGYVAPGKYSASPGHRPSMSQAWGSRSTESDHSLTPHSASVSGFAVLRGGRATDSSPYTMHPQPSYPPHPPKSGHSSADYFAHSYPAINNRPRATSQTAIIENAHSPTARESILVLSNTPSHNNSQASIPPRKKKSRKQNRGLLGNLLARKSVVPVLSDTDLSTDDSDLSADEAAVSRRSRRPWIFGKRKVIEHEEEIDGEWEAHPVEEEEEGGGEGASKSFVVMRAPRPISPTPPPLRKSALPITTPTT